MIIEGSKDVWKCMKPEHTVVITVHFKGHPSSAMVRADLDSGFDGLANVFASKREVNARRLRTRLLKDFYSVQEECLPRAAEVTAALLLKVSRTAQCDIHYPVFDQDELTLTFGILNARAQGIAYSIEKNFSNALAITSPSLTHRDQERLGNPCYHLSLYPYYWGSNVYTGEVAVHRFAPDLIGNSTHRDDYAALQRWRYRAFNNPDTNKGPASYVAESVPTAELPKYFASYLKPRLETMSYI